MYIMVMENGDEFKVDAADVSSHNGAYTFYDEDGNVVLVDTTPGIAMAYSVDEAFEDDEPEMDDEVEMDDEDAEVEAALEVLEERYENHGGARLALMMLRDAFEAE